MKVLTVKQPWASLEVEGIKDVENRTWPTKYRGRILIHAAATLDKDAIEKIGCISGEVTNKVWFALNDNKLPFGAIIGSVEIVDCVINHPSIWAYKSELTIGALSLGIKPIYNWVLANPIIFPEPIPCKGRLSLWNYPNILAETEEENGELFCRCQLPVKEENQVMRVVDRCYCRYCGGIWYK